MTFSLKIFTLDLTWKGSRKERETKKEGQERHLGKEADNFLCSCYLPLVTAV